MSAAITRKHVKHTSPVPANLSATMSAASATVSSTAVVAACGAGCRVQACKWTLSMWRWVVCAAALAAVAAPVRGGLHALPVYFAATEAILTTNSSDQADTVVLTVDTASEGIQDGAFVMTVGLDITSGLTSLPLGLFGTLTGVSDNSTGATSVDSFSLPASVQVRGGC